MTTENDAGDHEGRRRKLVWQATRLAKVLGLISLAYTVYRLTTVYVEVVLQ